MRIALKEDKSSPALWFNQVAKSGTLDENGEMTIDLIDKAEGEKTSSSNSNARKAVEQQVPGDDDGAGDDDNDDTVS